MSRLRRTIAARLVEAQATAAILTTFNEIDMSAVMARARATRTRSRRSTACGSASPRSSRRPWSRRCAKCPR
jgi:pyruvate/2-oxoglutarate dehydrogenase complex dihydrolipoamide acyltransferase (E2) component